MAPWAPLPPLLPGTLLRFEKEEMRGPRAAKRQARRCPLGARSTRTSDTDVPKSIFGDAAVRGIPAVAPTVEEQRGPAGGTHGGCKESFTLTGIVLT